MSLQALPISDFPSGNKKYHIYWLGKLSLPPEMLSQHTVRVHLKDRHNGYNDGEIHADVAVGYLPFLSVGSVWQNKHLVGYDGSYATFKVRFDRQNAKIINSGEHKGSDYAIPPFDYGLGGRSRLLETKCLSIKRRDDPYAILIPCWEIIRFYYAQSTALVDTIFSNTLELDDLRNPNGTERYSPESVRIRLRRYFTNIEAPLVARLVFSKYAFGRAKNIMASIERLIHNEKIPFPVAYPPFEGKTTIRVRGKWLSKKRFLVYQLIDCSGPFPFLDLQYDRDNQKINYGEKKPPKITRFPGHKQLRGDKEDTPEGMVRTGEPDKEETLKVLCVNKGCFKFLDKVNITQVEREITEKESDRKLYTGDRQNHQDYSTGQGTHGESDLNRLTLVPESSEADNVSPALDSFQKILAKLDVKYGVVYNFRRVNNRHPDGNYSYFPIVKRLRRPVKWSYINEMNRPRRCLIAEIIFEGSYFYLFESEHKPNEKLAIAAIADESESSLDDFTLLNILENCVKNRGIWVRNGEIYGLKKRRFNHGKKSYDRYAELIYLYLKSQTHK